LNEPVWKRNAGTASAGVVILKTQSLEDTVLGDGEQSTGQKLLVKHLRLGFWRTEIDHAG